MKFLQAIKFGHPFRRKAWLHPSWMTLNPNGELAWVDGSVEPEFLTGNNDYMDIMLRDLLADDWCVLLPVPPSSVVFRSSN